MSIKMLFGSRSRFKEPQRGRDLSMNERKINEKIRNKKKEQLDLSKLSKRTGFELGRRFSEFQPPKEDFSFQEKVLRETFGRGEHIWGTEMQPVKMNFDLNARQRGDRGTAELFGF